MESSRLHHSALAGLVQLDRGAVRLPGSPSQPRSREPPQRTGKSGLWGCRGCAFVHVDGSTVTMLRLGVYLFACGLIGICEHTAMPKRIKRSRTDLLRELSEQVDLLAHACLSFDTGLEPIGKHIALSLRVLLHHHGSSRALLEQLGLRSKRFMDTAWDLNPANLGTDCPLCVMRIGHDGSTYKALCQVGGGPLGERWIPFEKWWNNNVIKDDQGRFFCRRELIANVADTDGGAHVDPSLDEAYMDLSRNNSLGWVITRGDVQSPFPPPVMACLRQIAHEVLRTLEAKAKEVVKFTYNQ